MIIEDVIELKEVRFDNDEQAASFALKLLSNCGEIGGALDNIEDDGVASYLKRHSPRAW